jgi:hypothetical protein
LGADASVDPERAVAGRGPSETSLSRRGKDCISALSGVRPAPAAAIICGLRGLDAELARLPFLE